MAEVAWNRGFRRLTALAVVVAVAVLVLSACGSPSYGDLQVGDCVSGNPQWEDLYDLIECSEAAASGEVYYKVVNKAPDSEAGFSCSPFNEWITDGKWQICFEPTR